MLPARAASTGGDVQPSDGPLTSPYERPARPMRASSAPGTSTRPEAAGLRVSGTWRSVMRTTAITSGTLMRKMYRHENAVMM